MSEPRWIYADGRYFRDRAELTRSPSDVLTHLNRLEARIAELEASRTAELKAAYERIAELEADSGAAWNMANALKSALQAVEAEADALRESLRTIVDGLRNGWWGTGSGELEEGELWVAETLLSEKPETPAIAGEG